jgi:diphthine synthase
MLFLISLGISDEKDMSLKALEAGRACDRLYVEWYTSRSNATVAGLERLFGKRIHVLERAGLEEKSGKIIREAGERDVGILVGGDALFATTHLSLVLECRNRGIPWRIIHGSSILTAVGESGLSLYKFGEVVTVPRWKEKYRPRGFYETILNNRKMGLHSLILLETDMPAEEGLEILRKIERRRKKKLFQGKVVSVSRAGSGEQVIRYSKEAFGLPPAVLILPGRLNAFEKEFLESL